MVKNLSKNLTKTEWFQEWKEKREMILALQIILKPILNTNKRIYLMIIDLDWKLEATRKV